MRLKPDTFALTTVLALLTALGPLSTDMYLPALPAIAAELDAGTAGAQMTLSAFLLGFAVGQFVYGPVSDKLGRRPVLLAGLGLFLLASLVCALAPTIEALIGARFVQAFGASGPIVLARAIVRDLYEGPRAGRELSRMGTIMGVVPTVAPVLGGVLHAAFGWRAIFLAMVAFGLALGATVQARLPETIPVRSHAPLSFLAILRGFSGLLRHPGYRIYVALTSLAYGGLFAFISGSSFVLQGVFGLSVIQYAVSFGFVVIGFIAGTWLAQKAVARVGLDRTIRLGVALLAGAGVLMLLLILARLPSSLAVTLPMALYGVGVGLTMPQTVAAAMMPFPDRAGAASSLLGICQMTFAAAVGIGLGAGIGAAPIILPATIAVLGSLAFALFHGARRARSGA
jgi:DHA1 family bicyclomycin/chloramphenicol resistance-like MFS transporter